MNEKKLTDEEIINCFELCFVKNIDCDSCPYDNSDYCGMTNKDILELLKTQKAEIERLTEENVALSKGVKRLKKRYEETIKRNADECVKKFCETTMYAEQERLVKENAELQKRVDELMRDKGFLIAERTHIKEQAVKDTAKEILQMLYDDRNGYWDSCDCGKDETYWRDNSIQGTLNEIKERYGVEVE